MGRIKRGLDYFPLSTSFIHDRMVRRIMKHEGDSAFAVLVETLSYIYAGHGYYVYSDDEFYAELSDNLFSIDVVEVKRIIALAVEYGIFDSGLFGQHSILTSADIQRQYLFVTKRRTGLQIDAAYCLLEEEELASYKGSKRNQDAVAPQVDSVAPEVDDVTSEPENATLSTQNKREQNRTNQNTTNNLPNPPRGGDCGGNTSKRTKDLVQEDIDRMQQPADGVERNFAGLVDSLRSFKVPPQEQYAIILRSNYGAIGGDVWKGLSTIRGSNGKIKVPGLYLLSVLNRKS